jgi:flagellar biosynthetic protein FliQ
MTEAQVIEIGRQTIQVALLVALPMLAVSLVVGLVVSLFQVATSLQDATLTFVPKILAVGLTLLLSGHWILRILIGFTRQLMSDFTRYVG